MILTQRYVQTRDQTDHRSRANEKGIVLTSVVDTIIGKSPRVLACRAEEESKDEENP
jgi:hypothetical protein